MERKDLGEIRVSCFEYPERTKMQGVQAKLEIFFFALIDKYNLTNAEAVKMAARFNSSMAGLVDDIKTEEDE